MTATKLDHILAQPGALPPTLVDAAQTIREMLNQIRREVLDLPDRTSGYALAFSRLSAAESETIITIFGERGSGKSTLLQYVCAQLVETGHDLVIPIVRPERFARRDTVTGWVIAAMSRVLEISHPDALEARCRVGNLDMRLGEWIERVQRQETLIDGGYGERLPTHDLTPPEFARDAVQVNNAGATFAGEWFNLLDATLSHLFAKADRKITPLLIVPIDDADLRPDLLPVLLPELRRLASHPAVVVLFCANETTTRNALISYYLRGMHQHSMAELLDRGLIKLGDILEAVHTQLEKALPSHLRIHLRGLAPGERLSFTPITEKTSLADLLGQISVARGHLATLQDYFDFGERLGPSGVPGQVTPSPYADVLPALPRDLEHLYRILERIVARAPADTGSLVSEVAQVLLDQGMRVASIRVPPHHHQAIQWVRSPEGVGVEFDFRGLHFGKTVNPGFAVRRKEVEGVMVTNVARQFRDLYCGSERIGGDRMAPDDVLRNPDPSPSNEREILPSAFTHSLFLADEFARNGVFVHAGRRGSMTTPGGESWEGLFEVSAKDERTDNAFWLVPDWDDHIDYFLYSQAWNHFIDSAKEAAALWVFSDNALDLFLLGHLSIVCCIQQSRSVQTSQWDGFATAVRCLLERDEARWGETFTALQTELAVKIRDLYQVGLLPTASVRDLDFLSWVEALLPRAADPLCASAGMGEWILAHREEVVKEAFRLVQANHTAARSMGHRIQAHITEDWTLGPIHLLRQFDPALADALLARWNAERRRITEELEREIRILEEAGVPNDLIRRLQAFGINSEIANALIHVGVPREYVESLVSRFIRREHSSQNPAVKDDIRRHEEI